MNKNLLSLRILLATEICCAAILCSIFALHSHMTVDVLKSEPTIETKYVKQADLLSEFGPDVKARCDYKFMLESLMDYDIIENVEENNKFLVRIKISTVHARLSLPIEIFYPPAPDERTKAHEMGHAAICKRVYAKASIAVKEAAKPLLERIYTGQGASKEEACDEALQIALNELGNEYSINTADVTRDIFEIYDFLETDEHSDSSESVEESFRRFEHGKTRRISQNDKLVLK